MDKNKLKEKLNKGKVCIGTFSRLGKAAVEILGYMGWDFVILDMEHGTYDFPLVEDMVRSAKCAGITSIVRVAELNPTYIMRSLDCGSEGIQVPQVGSREDAVLVTKSSYYYPKGERGLCGFSRATKYTSVPVDEHIKTSNEEVIRIVHIEGKNAAKNLQEILDVTGIDVIFLGPWDLSQSVGVPGKVNHPKVIELMDEVIKSCLKKNIHVGSFASKPEDAKKLIDKGVKYIAYSTDSGILANAERELLIELKD